MFNKVTFYIGKYNRFRHIKGKNQENNGFPIFYMIEYEIR